MLHELERMMDAGMKIELLPSMEGIYRVNIIVNEKIHHGTSSFSLVRAIENAQQSAQKCNGCGQEITDNKYCEKFCESS